MSQRVISSDEPTVDAEVAFTIFDTPHGPMLAAVTPTGLVRLAFENEDFDVVLGQLGESVSAPELATERQPDGLNQTLDRVVDELGDYFAGRRRSFDFPLDLRLLTGFRREVVEEMCRIPYGSTTTYAKVAAAVGNPNAVRAVGGACSHNPLPVVIPCHRVLRTDGRTGEYLAGSSVKAALLTMESAA